MIQWEEPGTSAEQRPLMVRHEEMKKFLDQLKNKPGKWALLKVHETFRKASSQASNINVGAIRALEGCRAVSERGKVYVQWPSDTPADPPGMVTHDELRDYIDHLGNGWTPNELAEELRTKYDIYPRGHKP